MYTAKGSFPKHETKMSGPDSLSVWHESEAWGFESHSDWDIFCLKNFDTSTRISIRESKKQCCCLCKVDFLTVNFLNKNASYQWRLLVTEHDDVIKWKHFPRNWPFVRGIHRSLGTSPHKGQWRGALIFSFICVWINGLSKHSWGWWFKTLSCPLWRHCNETECIWLRRMC